jgi:hypothetical protein
MQPRQRYSFLLLSIIYKLNFRLTLCFAFIFYTCLPTIINWRNLNELKCNRTAYSFWSFYKPWLKKKKRQLTKTEFDFKPKIGYFQAKVLTGYLNNLDFNSAMLNNLFKTYHLYSVIPNNRLLNLEC